MQHHLTVLRDFGDYRRGNHSEDEAEVARILASEQRNHVVKVAADPKPEVEPAKDVKSSALPAALPPGAAKD